MDFLERYLHISPDYGSGTTEGSYSSLPRLLFLLFPRSRCDTRGARASNCFFRHLGGNARLRALKDGGGYAVYFRLGAIVDVYL